MLTMALVLALCSGSAFGAVLYSLGVGITSGVAWDGSQPVVSYHNANTAGAVGTFIWNPTTGSHQISTSGTTGGIARKGSSFVISGSSIDGAATAKRWDGSADGTGTWTNLPLGENAYNVTAYGVTASETDVYIAGYYTNNGANYACVYKESANHTFVQPVPSSPVGYHVNALAYYVSGSGKIAGQAYYGGSGGSQSGQMNAIGGWNGSTTCSLYTLNGTGAPSSSLQSSATAIAYNDSKIVGWTQTQSSPVSIRKACYWNGPVTANGAAAVAIPLLSGHDFSTATAVSADGSVIAGYSYLSSNNPGSRTCWLWDSVHGTRDLKAILQSCGVNTGTWQFIYVHGFANGGKTLTGYGYLNGDTSTYQAWAVTLPEPSSLVSLSLLALGMLPLIRRRSK